RGAGPGGDIGDFGLIGFVDGRLGKHVNVSANGGYILNSNPKGLGDFVLLDRPDELLTGIGLDFPINEHFQPVAEVRSTTYVGGHTPNAFNNNPVDVLGGIKIYPRRWFGFGLAYRRHLNQQDMDHFNPADQFNIPIQQVTNVNVVGRGLVVVPGTSRPVTSQGFPIGFIWSEEPNGFIAQFWVGHRNAREPIHINQAPVVNTVTPSISAIVRPCPPGQRADNCSPTDNTVTLVANATDPENDQLLYTWSVTGGRLSGEGRQVTWDLTGVADGTYTATVEVNDGNQHTATGNTTVTVAPCVGCATPPPPCPTVTVSCPSEVEAGQPITFTASVAGEGAPSPTYNWSVSAGTISSGQGTSTITVDTKDVAQSVTATVTIGGADPTCNATASCTTGVKPAPKPPVKFDEYGNIRFNDERARLDNYAIQLQNDPTGTGTIIVYGSCEGEAQSRGDRA